MALSITARVAAIAVIAETIRELKEVPSGVLYAHVMAHLSFCDFETAIGVLKGTNLIKESNHVLYWVGPNIKDSNG